jgi:AcrR family transcriptional regulator
VPRPREYDDDLRVRLIEEAARLLVEEGPAALTTRRVATAVGTSTTAIYSLVGSKDDLVGAVCAEGFTRLAAHLATVERTDDPLADLRGMGNAYLDMALESPALYRTMFGQSGKGITTGQAMVGLSALQMLIDGVQRCVDAGIFRGEAFALALRLWSVGHGVASLAIAGYLGPPDAARAVHAGAGEALVAGLLLDAGAEPDEIAAVRRSGPRHPARGSRPPAPPGAPGPGGARAAGRPATGTG